MLHPQNSAQAPGGDAEPTVLIQHLMGPWAPAEGQGEQGRLQMDNTGCQCSKSDQTSLKQSFQAQASPGLLELLLSAVLSG